MKDFAEQIVKNLESSGFPLKRVSLPTEKMYEVADTKGHSLNKVLDYLRSDMSIDSEIGDEKIVFSKLEDQTAQGFEGISPDMMQKAQEMMSKMDPSQLKEMQDKIMNMSDSERSQMMAEAKKMGML